MYILNKKALSKKMKFYSILLICFIFCLYANATQLQKREQKREILETKGLCDNQTTTISVEPTQATKRFRTRARKRIRPNRFKKPPKRNSSKGRTRILKETPIGNPMGTPNKIPTSSSENARDNGYVTYHPYNFDTLLTTVACSNGINGLITKFGYSDLSSLYPYVGAASFATWNSPECGGCWQLQNGAKKISITVIDQCFSTGESLNYVHFDISLDAFTELGGQSAIHQGHMKVSFLKLSSDPC